MQAFTLAVICCVILNEYFVKQFGLPAILRFLPEAMSAFVILYVLFAGTRDRFRLVAAKYWFLFGAMVVVIVCGIINNSSGAGPLLSAMRFYLRAVPLFFLPAVLPQTEEQIKRQLKWLLILMLVQVPVALYQRWIVEQEERFTGDDVRGTLMESGVLSLFLISVVVVLTALFFRHRIRPLWYLALFFLLLIPTTVNETKVTVIFLPVGLLVTLFIAADRGKKLKYFGVACAVLVLVAALFIPIYNFTQERNPYKNEKDITQFFSDKKIFGKYLSSDVEGLGTKKDVRREDAVVVPFQFLAQDPVRLTFGLGMGAVSPSTFGKNFEGEYYLLFQKFLITSLTVFLLEFGVLGVILIGVLLWTVLSDCLVVARQDDSFIGTLAAGWTGVVVIFAIDVGYITFHEFASVTYLFWYFSGLICARRVSLAYGRMTHSSSYTRT